MRLQDRPEWMGDLVACDECRMFVLAVEGVHAHFAAHRRRRVVHEASMESNRRGSDFQPGQHWLKLGGR